MNIHLQIDHLVLDGLRVEPGDGDLVRASIEAELTRLLAAGAEAPGLRSGRALASAPVEPIRLVDGDAAATVGRKIARAVYGGMTR